MTVDALKAALDRACDDVGIVSKSVPMDETFHATDIVDDPRGKGDGRIKLFASGEGGIAYNWKSRKQQVFFAQNEREQLSAPERQEQKRKRAEHRRLAEGERARAWKEAAARAVDILKAAPLATDDHPYLKRKNIKAHGLRLHHDGRLIVPLRDVDGNMQSLQFIDDAGEKLYLAGGKVSGGFYMIGTVEKASMVCIGEGFGTAATIYKSTGMPVVVAFDCGNLKPVAMLIRERYPDLKIILCADDDIHK